MIPALSKLLDVGELSSGLTVTVECVDNCSAYFLLMHFIDASQSKGMKTVIITSLKNEAAYRMTAGRMLIRLGENVKFVPLCGCLSAELKDCNASILEMLEKKISDVIAMGEKQNNGVCIIIDNATLLSDICMCSTAVVSFYRRLQNMLMERCSTFNLVAFHPAYCDTLTTLERNSDFVLRIKHIGTGFAKDVTGELVVFDRFNKIIPSKHVFHYYLTDKSVTLRPPGMSNPVM